MSAKAINLSTQVSFEVKIIELIQLKICYPGPQSMQIVTFNVNGIRAIKRFYLAQNRSYDDFLESFNAEILCFQEHKTNDYSSLDHEITSPRNFISYFAFPRKRRKIGYSGVVTYAKTSCKPFFVEEGISGIMCQREIPLFSTYKYSDESFTESRLAELDEEARVIILYYDKLTIMNIYFPNDAGPIRSSFRMSFYRLVELRCKVQIVFIFFQGLLEAGFNVIICGDINTTYHPRDHCDYVRIYNFHAEIIADLDRVINDFVLDKNMDNCSLPEFIIEFYSKEARIWLYRLILNGFFNDVFRLLEPCKQNHYTCWDQKTFSRSVNQGTRIDGFFSIGNFLQTEGIIKNCSILNHIYGSDHCPVMMSFDHLKILYNENNMSPTFSINLKSPSYYQKKRQSRLDSYFTFKKVD